MRKTGMWTIAPAVAVTMMLGGTAWAQTGTGTTGTQTGGQTGTTAGSATSETARPQGDLQKFLTKATIANVAEMELGRLALDRAQHPEVKQFAQMMVDEHTKSLEQLRQMASGAGVELPTALDEKHQKLHDKLSGLNGAEFDREYMNVMVKAHKSTEDLLEDRVERKSFNHPGMPGHDVGGTAGTSGTTGGTGSMGGTSSGTGSGSGGSTSGTSGAGTTGGGGMGTSGMGGTATTGTSGVTASARNSALDQQVDAWASTALTSVRAHLETAKDLQKRVKDGDKDDK